MKCPHCGKETERERPNTTEHRKETRAKKPPTLDFWIYAFREVYPRRSGGQRWPQADLNFAALVKRGIDPEVLVEKAGDYRAYCMLGNIAPQYVMQAATFLGRGGGWEEDWCKNAKPFSPFDQARRQLQEQT